MAEKACVKRLQIEYRSLCKQPVSHVTARPSPTDILEWHYVLEGSEGTPFSGGYYYGTIKFPPDYPYKPPGITMITPNGRFMTQKKICLSMSDFHPESWNPMWSVESILTGLLSFMMDSSPTTGSVSTTDIVKQRLAKTSLAFNCTNPTFRKIFPEYIEKYEKHQKLSNQPNTNDDELLVSSAQLPHNPTLLEKRVRNQGGEEQQQQPRKEEEEEEAVNNKNLRRQQQQQQERRKQSLPTWVLVLLFSVFGIVMALPLLQL